MPPQNNQQKAKKKQVIQKNVASKHKLSKTSGAGGIKKQKTVHHGKPSYRALDDNTLTLVQQKRGGFFDFKPLPIQKKKITKGAFRFESNPTVHGYSSGYHESGITTDTTDHLWNRTQLGNGLSAFPSAAPTPLKGEKFYESNVDSILKAGDGARTDTAQTILSVPQTHGGGSAGHSGSNVKTTKQKQAHDLLRKTTVDMLRDNDMTPGVASVTFGALTVASMAPGNLASQAVDAKKIKASQIKDHWESQREEAKSRVEHMYQTLSPKEQARVNHHMSNVFKSLPSDRRLANGRCTSPVRDKKRVGTNALTGGGYVSSSNDVLPTPTHSLPIKGNMSNEEYARTATLYMTQPFRGRRK